MTASLLRALSLGALLACAGGASAIAAGDASITVDNFTFTPASLTIQAGTKVTWTNRDDIPHTVVEDATPRDFKSSPLDTGDSFSFVFAKAGTYHFFCSLHPHMQGVVVVR